MTVAQPPGLINTSERPRLLIRGFQDEDDLVARLAALCPTAKVIASLGDVRQAEWDLLVTTAGLSDPSFFPLFVPADTHLCVVVRKPTRARVVEARTEWGEEITSFPYHVSAELQRVPNLSEPVAALVHEQLEPVLMARSTHQVFGCTLLDGRLFPEGPPLQPFIQTGDGEVLAGRYARSDQSEAWVLPEDTPDLVAWVRAALGEWHMLAPDRFPGLPQWSAQPTWSTPAEIGLRRQVVDLQVQRRAAIDEFDAREATLKAELGDVQDLADAYERALLTTQGDPLKFAVMRVLQEFGFDVTDSDATAAPGDHLEDLQARDGDAPNWIALVEVKGYAKGAKTEAIGQFGRFERRFVAKHGHTADAQWYIVNQFLARDPSTRPLVMAGNNDDVAAFAGNNGLIVDTVTLFELLKRVREATTTTAAVRELLRTSTGRLTLPGPRVW